MSEDARRFGEFVRLRRRELGLTYADVVAAGGPSDTTLTKIENNLASRFAPKTLQRLEHALGWERGSARAVLDGGEPRLVDEDQDLSAFSDRALLQELERRLARRAEDGDGHGQQPAPTNNVTQLPGAGDDEAAVPADLDAAARRPGTTPRTQHERERQDRDAE